MDYTVLAKLREEFPNGAAANDSTQPLIRGRYVLQRLLDADPTWTWEPLSVDSTGCPKIVETKTDYMLWIRLVVGGVSRIGVGIVPKSSGSRTDNQPPPYLAQRLVINALRNAALYFGVGLDLTKPLLDEIHLKQSSSTSHDHSPSDSSLSRSKVQAKRRLVALMDGDIARAAEEWQRLGLDELSDSQVWDVIAQLEEEDDWAETS